MSDLKQGELNELPEGSVYQVCVYQFHSEDEDEFQIFWAFLVPFGLGTMCKEGKCEI